MAQNDFGSIPTVDFSLATSDSENYYHQLRYALEEVGFVIFVNVPGFEDTFQRVVFAAAEELFSRPDSWKDQLSASRSYALRGHLRGDDIAGPHKVRFSPSSVAFILMKSTSGARGGIPFWG